MGSGGREKFWIGNSFLACSLRLKLEFAADPIDPQVVFNRNHLKLYKPSIKSLLKHPTKASLCSNNYYLISWAF